MSAPPVPGKANLHVALAMALGASPQETDAQLIARVEKLRTAAAAAHSQEGLFSLFDEVSA